MAIIEDLFICPKDEANFMLNGVWVPRLFNLTLGYEIEPGKNVLGMNIILS